MNNRERVLAILRYQPYDRMSLVHFSFWGETMQRWAAQGHVSQEEADGFGDGNELEDAVCARLGFDLNWNTNMHLNSYLSPCFEREVIAELPDGSRHVRDGEGVIVLESPGATSIPAEIDHLLKTRDDWEAHYLPRLQFAPERVLGSLVRCGAQGYRRFDQGGLEYLRAGVWEHPQGLFCGSMFGRARNILGVVGASYLLVDDEPLFDEIVDTLCELNFQCAKMVLEAGARFDFLHFWEDICFKSGPLIHPKVFAEKVGPHYKRITQLGREHGIELVSVDCDGKVDELIPAWLDNGVNIMFPIEVGTWGSSIGPWRERFGRELRGVGGMNKNVLARDRAAVDAEIERLAPLVDLGGYIPCPDHRLAPDAEWDLVRYYCDRMRARFGG